MKHYTDEEYQALKQRVTDNLNAINIERAKLKKPKKQKTKNHKLLVAAITVFALCFGRGIGRRRFFGSHL